MERQPNLAGVVVLLVLACSEPPPGHVELQVTSRPAPDEAEARPLSRTAGSDSAVFVVESDTIVVRRIELVVRHLWLQPADHGECDPEEGEYCAELKNEPVVIAFPLADTAEPRFIAAAKPGGYSGLQIEVFNPMPGKEDGFLAAHPEFAGSSVRLQGVFSRGGVRREFDATTDLTGIQELALAAPVTIAAGDTAHLTLRLDLARALQASGGAGLVDPATIGTGQSDAHVMQDNIRVALQVFEDEDADGLSDAGTHP